MCQQMLNRLAFSKNYFYISEKKVMKSITGVTVVIHFPIKNVRYLRTWVSRNVENKGEITDRCSQPSNVLNADRYSPDHIRISPK